MTHTCTRATSSGNHTLSEWLTWAIVDYRRVFGREPKLIVIPYFRQSEMDEDMRYAFSWKNATFKGIRFRFTLMSDVIELRGHEF